MSEWQTIELGQVATFQRGFDLPHHARRHGDVPVVSSAGVSGYHDAAMVDPPGVVTGRYGTIGEVFYIKQPFWPLNTTLFVRDFHGNDRRFIYYHLQRFDFVTFSGKSGVPGVNRNELHRELVTLPTDVEEQHAIASALSDMDALLERLEQLIAKKRDLKQATMQQLLSGQTRLRGFSEPWEPKKLGDIGEFFKGSGVNKDEAHSGNIACVRYGEIYTHHNDYIRQFNSWISATVAKRATRIKQGDLLFTGSGETKEEIGKCVAFINDFEAYAGGDIVILRPVGVDSLFMGYFCNTRPVTTQKASRGQGDAVVHINSKSLADIDVILPSLSEQSAIASVISDLDAELEALEERLAKTSSLKLAMMQELLTGKTRLVAAEVAIA